jgi:hypothetical protein
MVRHACSPSTQWDSAWTPPPRRKTHLPKWKNKHQIFSWLTTNTWIMGMEKEIVLHTLAVDFRICIVNSRDFFVQQFSHVYWNLKCAFPLIQHRFELAILGICPRKYFHNVQYLFKSLVWHCVMKQKLEAI